MTGALVPGQPGEVGDAPADSLALGGGGTSPASASSDIMARATRSAGAVGCCSLVMSEFTITTMEVFELGWYAANVVYPGSEPLWPHQP